MSGKFVMCITGPGAMYRLDLLKKACPDILKDYLIVFTDTYSLNLYKDYHKDFNFVDFEEIRRENQYDFSVIHERFLQAPNEKEFFEKFSKFYFRDGARPGRNVRLYSHDMNRMAMPWLAENDILNFALVDNDYIISNDKDVVDTYFKKIPDNTLYTLWFYGGDQWSPDLKRIFFQKEIQPHFLNKGFDFSKPKNNADGWLKGFKMGHKNDVKLFFDIWNKSVEKIVTDNFYLWNLTGGYVMLDCFWISPWVMQFFESWGYNIKNYHELQLEGWVGKHWTRVEDTFYYGRRPGWERFNFDYTDTSCVAGFVKNNKQGLKEYYEGTYDVDVTDTHAYTSVRKMPDEAKSTLLA